MALAATSAMGGSGMTLPRLRTSGTGEPYAPNRLVTRVEDCYFYHTMDLPGHGTVHGAWDLRDCVDDYLGHVPLEGKRILEMGTASGCVCFEMERRGADVVACDLDENGDWDTVPYHGTPYAINTFEKKRQIRQLNNGWWFAHRRNKSDARVVYSSVYEVPESIGPVDVATFGCLLLHLRDPFQALYAGTKQVGETVIVTQHAEVAPRLSAQPSRLKPQPRRWRGRLLHWIHKLLGDGDWWGREEEAVRQKAELEQRIQAMNAGGVQFLPDGTTGQPTDTWWYYGPDVLRQMLGVLGFPRTELTWFSALYDGNPQLMFTLVGHR